MGTSIRISNARLGTRDVDLRIAARKIVEIGEVAPTVREDVVDLGGRVIIAGLRDAHVHFTLWAHERLRTALNADLRAATSATAVADAITRHVAGGELATSAGVIRGAGFAMGTWDDAPHKALLDGAVPGEPVVLVSLDAHSSWWSSAALSLIGLDHHDGLLREEESWNALLALPQPSDADVDAVVAAGMGVAASRGVTAITDFEMGGAIEGWARRVEDAEQSMLPLRVTSAIMAHELDTAVHRGFKTGVDLSRGRGMLTVGPLKLFADGALGSRTAHCDHAYVGEPDNTGRVLADTGELIRVIRRGDKHGLVATVHAIGDAANRSALDAFERLGLPGRIEHAQLVNVEDLARFRHLDVVASIQPSHAVEDRDLVARWWSDRTARTSPLRSLLEAGAQVVFGSDAPVSELSPWRSIQAAVARTFDDRPPWLADEAIGLRTALALSRATPIAVGEPADLVVLDADPEEVAPTDLGEMPVHATMCAGAWTFRSE